MVDYLADELTWWYLYGITIGTAFTSGILWEEDSSFGI